MRYTQSALGVVWAFLHPAVMTFLYWFVFSFGLKLQPAGNAPFLIWFFCGFIPWISFSEMITMITPSVVNHPALIKRTLFPSEIFPVIYALVSGFGHIIMMVILLLLLLLSHIPVTWYALQFFYYSAGLILLTIGLGWLFSSLNVLSRDIGQLVAILLQVWFWATPIIYGPELVPHFLHWVLQINPLYYVVHGYRNTFVYFQPFWNDGVTAIIFWGEVLTILILGGFVFKRFKPEFADIL
ncbi:MAG: ABC transporter permease [SAR324 cluster bacterium]|nr:ABC transporter permease [SAR324 cluster bacterium]